MCTIPNALDLRRLDASGHCGRRRAHAPRAGTSTGRRYRAAQRRPARGRTRASTCSPPRSARCGTLGTIADGRWRWVIVGDGPFRARARHARSRVPGSRDRVVLAGRLRRRELHAWYEAANAVRASRRCTKAARSSRSKRWRTVAPSSPRAPAGLPDKVRPGVNGWLVPPGDASALAGAISGALGRPEQLPAFGLAGRAIVEREFSWNAAASQTIALYERLLGRTQRDSHWRDLTRTD